MNLNELARQEIVHFHEQIEKWFKGEMTPGEREEMLKLSPFHTNFRMINPRGVGMNRTALGDWLPSVYAAKPGIVLEVKNISPRFEQEGVILMEYVETQTGGGADNQRISTALFVQNEEGHLQWLDLHETFLP